MNKDLLFSKFSQERGCSAAGIARSLYETCQLEAALYWQHKSMMYYATARFYKMRGS